MSSRLSALTFGLLLAAPLAAPLSAPLAAQQPAAVRAPAARPRAGALTERLSTDPKVRIGTLPNGIRYYIRQNALPAKRAELRLVVNAGSVLEAEDQRGYA